MALVTFLSCFFENISILSSAEEVVFEKTSEVARHEDVMVLGWHHVTHGGNKIPLSYDSTKVAYEPISSEKGEFFLFSGNNADSSWNELYVMKTEWIKHGIPAGRIPLIQQA